MIDVETQLQEYWTVHDQEWGPITSEDMLAGFVAATSPDERPARRLSSTATRIVIGISAAAATALLFGLIPVLLTQSTTEEDTTSAETVIESPAPDVSADDGWVRVGHDESVFGGEGSQWMNAVTVGGPGFVAVGGSNNEASVWTSTDGIRWSRLPPDGSVFSEAMMNSVTAWGSNLIAVGSSGVSAAAWITPDGIAWSRVAIDNAAFGESEMNSVTAWGSNLIAVGRSGDSAAAWHSADGIDWSRVDHDESVFGGADSQEMLAVTTGGPGLVAVGYDGLGGEQSPDRGNAAVWTSDDGIRWSRVPHDDSVFGGLGYSAMLDVTTGGPGLVAVGHEPGGAVVWTSTDGTTWSRIRVHETISGGYLAAVSTVGLGVVAVGDGGQPGSNGPLRVVVWTSVDGINWTHVPHDEAVFADVAMADLMPADNGLISVGGTDRQNGENAAVLVWEP